MWNWFSKKETPKEAIIAALSKALQEAGIEVLPDVQFATDLQHGDYTSNAAMIHAKALAMNPRALAEKLVQSIGTIKHIKKIEIAGPGFINFWLSDEYLLSEIETIKKESVTYGSSKLGQGKKALVEYSSPNIAKPFTIGHLRSTIIGDAIANILSFSGYTIIRDNHLGDWGTQFGKTIVALEKWGSREELEKNPEPMKYIVELYVRFHDEAEKDPTLDDVARARFLDLEKGEASAKEMYDVLLKYSQEYFNSIYERLQVSQFDTELGESQFIKYTDEVVSALKAKNLLQTSEDARVVFLEDENMPPLIVIKKDGSTIYATRDLGCDMYRLKTYGKHTLIINEVGGEQSLYFKQLFAVEKKLGWVASGQRVHVAHGLYRFEDGKMSTRKGNVIWLESILDEADKKAGEINEMSKHDVSVGAIKFNDLKRESKNDIIFNLDDIVTLKGDSGPYVQYATVRAKALIEKAKQAGIMSQYKKIDSADLARVLARFPGAVERSAAEYSAHYIANYLLEVSAAFNSFYARGAVIDSKHAETSAAKLALVEASAIVLQNGLKLLGIRVPERM